MKKAGMTAPQYRCAIRRQLCYWINRGRPTSTSLAWKKQQGAGTTSRQQENKSRSSVQLSQVSLVRGRFSLSRSHVNLGHRAAKLLTATRNWSLTLEGFIKLSNTSVQNQGFKISCRAMAQWQLCFPLWQAHLQDGVFQTSAPIGRIRRSIDLHPVPEWFPSHPIGGRMAIHEYPHGGVIEKKYVVLAKKLVTSSN